MMKSPAILTFLAIASTVTLLPLVSSAQTTASPPDVKDANSIVAKADGIRAPGGSYEFEATVLTYEGDKKKSESGYKVFVKDLDHVLVPFISPLSERGKSLLMLGEDLWIYLPNVKKPVRIPFQQRLVGDVSNGDITRLNFSVDYDAKLEGEESVDGKDCHVLDLTAKNDSKTYHKIKYWVAKADSRPVKAEYFTVSGQSLKTCVFEDFRAEAGGIRPTRLVYHDSLKPTKKSVLLFNNMRIKSLSDGMFTKDYLKTLE